MAVTNLLRFTLLVLLMGTRLSLSAFAQSSEEDGATSERSSTRR